MTLATMAIIVIVINTAFTFLLFKGFSKTYSIRFSRMSQIFAEAMAERDAALQKLKASIARDYIMDASKFDAALEDVSDFMPPSALTEIEGSEDEHEEEDHPGAE